MQVYKVNVLGDPATSCGGSALQGEDLSLVSKVLIGSCFEIQVILHRRLCNQLLELSQLSCEEKSVKQY